MEFLQSKVENSLERTKQMKQTKAALFTLSPHDILRTSRIYVWQVSKRHITQLLIRR